MNEPTEAQYSETFAFGPFRLNARERRLTREGRPVVLTGKTLDLLLLLVRSAGRLVTREALIEALWPKAVVEEHSLTWYVSALRKALGDEGESPRYIETVRGHGYRFVPTVTVEETARAAGVPARPRRRTIAFVAGGLLLVSIAVAAGVFFRLRAVHSAAESPASARTRSLAVLPFENLSADPANAYFASGIQDLILTKLAGIRDLHVVSRTSTERYASHPADLREVGRQLGVASVLEGSVQKAGDQVLVNVQLIDTKTGEHLWAQAYTRTLDNVFGVESEVAERVAAALRARLLPEERTDILRPPTENARAYDLFLKAEYIALAIEEGNVSVTKREDAAHEAIDLYRRAIAQDPKFALAYARLSFLESYYYWFSPPRDTARLAAARKAAQQALALAPDLAQAHLAMGYVLYWGDHDYDAALKEFRVVHDRLPNDAEALGAIGLILRRQGHWDEAVRDLRETADLDLYNPRWRLELGFTLALLGRYAEAEREFDRVLAASPDNYDAAIRRVWLMLASGRPDAARHLLAAMPAGFSRSETWFTVGARYEAAWLQRDPAAALKALEGAPLWIAQFSTLSVAPVDLLKGQALALQGEDARARAAFSAAREVLQKALKSRPDSPDYWSALGLAEAALGEKGKAIEAGKTAVRLMTPYAQDAVQQPAPIAALAAIYARCGEPAEAVRLLRRLMARPSGLTISVALLKLDPAWDPIRSNPGFQKLVAAATPAVAPGTN